MFEQQRTVVQIQSMPVISYNYIPLFLLYFQTHYYWDLRKSESNENLSNTLFLNRIPKGNPLPKDCDLLLFFTC